MLGVSFFTKANQKDWLYGLLNKYDVLDAHEATVLWDQGEGVPPKKPNLGRICELFNQLSQENCKEIPGLKKAHYSLAQDNYVSSYRASLWRAAGRDI